MFTDVYRDMVGMVSRCLTRPNVLVELNRAKMENKRNISGTNKTTDYWKLYDDTIQEKYGTDAR